MVTRRTFGCRDVSVGVGVGGTARVAVRSGDVVGRVDGTCDGAAPGPVAVGRGAFVGWAEGTRVGVGRRNARSETGARPPHAATPSAVKATEPSIADCRRRSRRV